MIDLKTLLENQQIGSGYTPGTSVALHVNHRLAKLTLSEFEGLIKNNSDLTLASWRVLVALHQMGRSSQKLVVEFCRLDQGQVSRALRFLEGKDFVRSGESDLDRRSRVFSITPLGEEYRQGFQPIVDEFHERMSASLTDEELQLYINISTKIANAAIQTLAPTGDEI
jgi:DNA-binding MarR family transcriptional regulator